MKLNPKTLRKLRAAEGYLELDLPTRAMAELDEIEDTSNVEAAVSLLRGEALKGQQKYTEAVEPLKRAVAMIPAPLNSRAWSLLSECYRLAGRTELAEIVELMAQMQPPTVQPAVFNVSINMQRAEQDSDEAPEGEPEQE